MCVWYYFKELIYHLRIIAQLSFAMSCPLFFFTFGTSFLSASGTQKRERGNKRQKDGAGPGRYTAGGEGRGRPRQEKKQNNVLWLSIRLINVTRNKEKGEMEQNRRT